MPSFLFVFRVTLVTRLHKRAVKEFAKGNTRVSSNTHDGFPELSEILVRVYCIRHISAGMAEDSTLRIFIDFRIIHQRGKRMTAIVGGVLFTVDPLHDRIPQGAVPVV